jgi:hypothetical protein
MSAVFYSKGWFRAKKKPLELFSEERARALHEKGELYCALIGSTEKPNCFLEVTSSFVGVGFLDEELRENLSYSFQQKESGRLFLSMATWREYEGSTDKVVNGTTYIFGTNGTLSIRKETFTPEHILETSTNTADVSGNWEKFPLFGNYGCFTRAER